MRALHASTIEITREGELSPGGDCVLGVRASGACSDIPDIMKKRLKDPDTRVRLRIIVDNMAFDMQARGSQNLTLEHTGDIVIRRSSFCCPRTMAVGANAAADAIPREMVRALCKPGARGRLLVSV